MIKNLIKKIKKYSSAKSESETEYDGFLSYSSEIHAFITGIGAGFASYTVGSPEVGVSIILVSIGYGGYSELAKNGGEAPEKISKELQREPWYAIGGTFLGFLIGGALQLGGFYG